MSWNAWTPECDARLAALYPNDYTDRVAEAMGRSLGAVRNRAQKLGLKKTEEFHLRKPGLFRNGHTTWNKGKPHPAARSEAVQRTWFKPGHLSGQAARNYRRIGSLRVNDGVLQRKVTDDPKLKGSQKWQPVHRLVWEAANGPVPAGYVVVFKQGRHTLVESEITLDRLDCISRAENMRRNSHYTRLPPDVARLVQLRGALNRKINTLSKRIEE